MAEQTIPIKLVDSFYADSYTDVNYGSYIEFTKGETKLVPYGIAIRLLAHTDVYVRGNAKTAVPAYVPDKPEAETDTQDVRDSIARMTREELIAFADSNYRQKFNRNLATETMREECVRLVDIQGVI